MSLRVAHVLNSPGLGGVPRVVHALARLSDPGRVRPHVFFMKPGGGGTLFDDLDLPQRAARSASKATAMMELVDWLDRHRIDILHTHSLRPNLYARMAGVVLKPAGLKIVAHYHNDYSDKWVGPALTLERRLAGVTDAAVAVSSSVARQVQGRVGTLPEVVWNGIDTGRVTGGNRDRARRRLSLGPDDVAVGLVGRICRQKGIDTFVDAASLVAPICPHMRFLVAGDVEDRALCEALTRHAGARGLDRRIRFLGHRDDIADILAALDLLVAPSRWEGFGMAIAEAMAAGIPVVAAAVGGIPDVAGGAACLVPPDDPRALAREIRRIAAGPGLQNDMKRAGLRRGAKFDWAVAAARVADIYDRIGRAP